MKLGKAKNKVLSGLVSELSINGYFIFSLSFSPGLFKQLVIVIPLFKNSPSVSFFLETHLMVLPSYFCFSIARMTGPWPAKT